MDTLVCVAIDTVMSRLVTSLVDVCLPSVLSCCSCVWIVNLISGGYCGGVPPLPIPNREVKPACADGTAMQCGRVGGRLLYESRKPWRAIFRAFFIPEGWKITSFELQVTNEES